MAFDDKELQQLNQLLDRQHSAIILDVGVLLRMELEKIERRLDQLLKMETEDVTAINLEIIQLKRQVKKIEARVVALER